MKGVFISLEGGDGAGKTTLMEGIYAHLLQKGEQVVKTRAPGGTKIGEEIRSLLLHGEAIDDRCELFLFLADRAEHMGKVILPALQSGKVVLCDRFNDSTVAYQGVARGLDSQNVRSLCLFATQGIEPDITLYLDLPPRIGLSRVKRKADRIESESLSFHESIRSAFLKIAKEEPGRVVVLDATNDKDAVLSKALEHIYAIFSLHR